MKIKPVILLVEGDTNLAYAYKIALEENFNVELVTNGRDAIDWLQHNIPEIVILELHLTIKSGHHVLEYIKSDGRLNHAKLIVVSTFGEWIENAATDPRIAFAKQKPIGFAELRNIVAKIFASPV